MRSAQFADDFEAAQDKLIGLVESLTPEQWKLVGRNYPERFNDEDEGRTVGVIAHHVAESGPLIADRIELQARGETPPPVADFTDGNARHAEAHADCTPEEVLRMLRESKPRIAAQVRAIPDDRLEYQVPSRVGPMTIAQRVERVLIGHVKMHHGSIEAALKNP